MMATTITFYPAFSFPKQIYGTNSNFGSAFTFSSQKSIQGNQHFEDFHLLDLTTTSLTMRWQPVHYTNSSKVFLVDKLLLELHFNQNGETSFESLLNKANYSKEAECLLKKKKGKRTLPSSSKRKIFVLSKLNISPEMITVIVSISIVFTLYCCTICHLCALL